MQPPALLQGYVLMQVDMTRLARSQAALGDTEISHACGRRCRRATAFKRSSLL